MIRNIRVAVEAKRELKAAVAWNEEHSPGRGADLWADANAAIAQIAAGAHGSPIPGTPARRLPLANFPISIVFVERQTHAHILAFAHQRRRPEYWWRRVPPP